MQNMINKFSNMPNISGIFNNSYYLNASVKCGSRVVDFSNAYMSCRNVKGPAVCGDNVTNMAYSYCYCPKITGSPVCGSKVINMSNTYNLCTNLTGAPVCGANVTDFTSTYMSCSKLPGPAVCGPKVTNMYQAYRSCGNLIGAPACGDNVTDMSASYLWCSNMQGYTSIGPKVTNMYESFKWCGNLRGDCIIYSNNVTNMTDAFSQRNNSRTLRIFVPKGTTTNTTAMQLNCTGSNSGWANFEKGNHRHHWDSNTSIFVCEKTNNLIAVYGTREDFFVPTIITNTSSNYTNYVAVVKAMDSFANTITVTNYSGSQIANRKLGAASISEPTIINLSDSFNKELSAKVAGGTEYRIEIYKNDSNVKVTGFDFYNKMANPSDYSSYLNILYLDHSLTNISNMCSGINWTGGDGWSGPNVTNMAYAYSYTNIDGCPECGHKVSDFSHAYQRCFNLIGPAVCGPNVTNMYMTYDGCFELTGTAACGPKVTDMYRAYQVTNVTTGVIGASVTNTDSAYSGCANMRYVNLQNGLTKIGRDTFSSCTNLVSATIPNTVTDINSFAFSYCTNLMLLRYLYRTTVPTLGANTFDYCGTNSGIGKCYHFVPNDILNTWKNSWTVVPSDRFKPINSALAPFSDTIPDSGSLYVGDTITMTWYVLNYGSRPTCSVTTDSGTSTYYSLSSVTVTEVGDFAWKCTFTITGRSAGSEYLTMRATGSSSGGVNGFSYSSSIEIRVREVTGSYSVNPAGTYYQFALNSNGYYESNNKGVSDSAAISRVDINNPDGNEVIFQCINYAESSFDYGYLSKVNNSFGLSYTSDDSASTYHSFKGNSSSAIQEVSYGRITSGSIYVKFVKDSSVNSNNDSLQFKVVFR